MWLWCALVCASLGPTSLGLSELPETSWKSVSFARLGKFPFIMFSHKFSISCSSSSPSGTPMIQMFEHFKLSQRFLSLSSFFWILVSSFCLVECLFLPSAPNCWFESWFPLHHCWFTEYFACFHFGYLSFVFFKFFNQAQSDLWAFWLPGFKFSIR